MWGRPYIWHFHYSVSASAPVDDTERTLVVSSVLLHLHEVCKDLCSIYFNTGLICDDLRHLQHQTIKMYQIKMLLTDIFWLLSAEVYIFIFHSHQKKRNCPAFLWICRWKVTGLWTGSLSATRAGGLAAPNHSCVISKQASSPWKVLLNIWNKCWLKNWLNICHCFPVWTSVSHLKPNALKMI